MKKFKGDPLGLIIILLILGGLTYFYINFQEMTKLKIGYVLMVGAGIFAFLSIKGNWKVKNKTRKSLSNKITYYIILSVWGLYLIGGWISFFKKDSMDKLHSLIIYSLCVVFFLIGFSQQEKL